MAADSNEKVLLTLLEVGLDHESLEYSVTFVSFDKIIKINYLLECNEKEQNSFYTKIACATTQQSYRAFLCIDFCLKGGSYHLNILSLYMNM